MLRGSTHTASTIQGFCYALPSAACHLLPAQATSIWLWVALQAQRLLLHRLKRFSHLYPATRIQKPLKPTMLFSLAD